MAMWTIPAIIAGVVILFISYYLTVGVMKKTQQRASAADIPISKAIRDHPFVLNPIIIMYIIFLLFTGIIIFYYWSKYGY